MATATAMAMAMAMTAAVGLTGGACSRFLDHSAQQCQTADDCVGFGNHPYCQDKVCVPSGLAPKTCFFSTEEKPPVEQLDFLNRCSTSFLSGGHDIDPGQCLAFMRTIDSGATLKDPPPPMAPPAKTQGVPTALCKDLVPAGGSILYLSGSSNFQPLLQELAPVVVANTGIRPVFRITTSCSGVKSMNPLSPADHTIKDPVLASESYAQIFLGDGPGVGCLLGTGGQTVDLGESEIFPETCGPPVNSPEDIAEGLGPILPIVFVVPPVSTERAISYEAAQQVFGGGGGIDPWRDPGFIYVRGAGTATLRLVAKELDLMPTKVWGIDQGSAGSMATNLASITDGIVGQTAIGIIGSDFYDFYRGSLKALAFQAKGQLCAYVPDSSLTTRDKINVRDGHYPLWGRIHFFAAKKNGLWVSDVAQRFVLLLTNANLAPKVLDAFIDAGFVPPCAMRVKRNGELGDLLNNDPPPFSCGCAFDARVNPNPDELSSDCKPCNNNSDCKDSSRPSCNYNFCEAVQ